MVLPNRPSFIQVMGAVNTESAMLWQPGKTVSDYLDQSGVSTLADEDATFIVRPNGMVISQCRPLDIKCQRPRGVSWRHYRDAARDVESNVGVLYPKRKDITQIFSNMGIGAAAIRSMRQ